MHASRLITALQAREPGFQCSGYGGPKMQAAGCHVDFRLTELAIIGLGELAPKVAQFHRLYREAGKRMAERRPDAVLLVDYPGFNWWIATAAKRLGIPVIYYLPPQLWAWAPWRIRRVRKYVDHVLCCLPFEYEWYRSRGVSAEFVGHPFFDEVAEHPLDPEFLAKLAAQRVRGERVIGILPGSRSKEVRLNFPVQCAAMRAIRQRLPETRFHVAAFKPEQAERCREHLRSTAPDLPAEVHVGKTSEVIEGVEACLMVSGSVSLELLARRTPGVVLYRVDWLTNLIGRMLVTCRYMSLPNLLADRPLMPEFLPLSATTSQSAQMAGHLVEWLTTPGRLAQKRQELDEVRQTVAIPGATGRAADAILARLRGTGRKRRVA
jgi:lipid-A-disaccharide synthase